MCWKKKILDFYGEDTYCYYSPSMLEEKSGVPKEIALEIQRELSSFGFLKQGGIYETGEIAYRFDPHTGTLKPYWSLDLACQEILNTIHEEKV